MRRGYALLRRLTTPLPRLLPALAAALLVSGGVERPIVSRDAVRPDPAMCSADLLHPLQVELVPLDAPTPGKQVRVRVRVQAQARIDDVTVEVRPVGGISVVRDGELPLGLLPSGGSAETVFTVQLPNDRVRRTVDVRVSGHIDGLPMERGATLNLNFDPEPATLIEEPGGRRIRQVEARRDG